MESFIAFDQGKKELFKLKVRHRFGEFQTPMGEKISYVDVLSHDVAAINEFIKKPQGQLNTLKRLQAAQEEYKRAYQSANNRWQQSGKSFEVGATVVKDLSFWQQKLKKEKGKWDITQNKVQEIEAFLEQEPWERLENIARELDRHNNTSTVNELRRIKVEWQAQGNLATFSTEDLITLQNRLDDLENLINQFNQHAWNANDPTEQSIRSTLAVNARYIARYQERIVSAIEWRLKGATVIKNLYSDDALFVLKREIKNNVFKGIQPDAWEHVYDLLDVSVEGHSFNMTFERCVQCLEIIRRHRPASDYEKKLKTWFSDRENDPNDLFPLESHRSTLIPSMITRFIPSQEGWVLSGLVRYWYLFTQMLNPGMMERFLKYMMGSYEEVALFLNETYRHVQRFEDQINNREEGKIIDFESIIDLAAFRSALEINSFIDKELKRSLDVQNSWWTGSLFRFGETYQMMKAWRVFLGRYKKEIYAKCERLCTQIVNDIEKYILDSIKLKSFKLSRSALVQIKQFVAMYGNKESKARFSEVTCPLSILKKFNFFKPGEDVSQLHDVDEDAVYAFWYFGQCFWEPHQQSALEILMRIIRKIDLPQNEEEESALLEKLKPLFSKGKGEEQYKDLMTFLTSDFFLKTGDDGTAALLYLTNRYAPNVAEHFKQEREKNGEAKYLFLFHLLSRKEGNEFDLSSDESVTIQDKNFTMKAYKRCAADISNNHGEIRDNFLPKLKEKMDRYMAGYTGSNLAYSRLIFTVSPLFPTETFLPSYVEKRFEWILNRIINDEEVSLSQDEYPLYVGLKHHPIAIEKIINLIKTKCDGSESKLIPFLKLIDEPQLIECFYEKYFRRQCLRNKYEKILNKKDMFKTLSESEFFKRAAHNSISYLLNEIKGNEDLLTSESLWEVIETFGSIQNKESYRLLRLKRLIENESYSDTVKFINALSGYVSDNLSKATFTLQTSQEVLVNLYRSHLNKTSRSPWSGHLQYFFEYFLPESGKELLFELRYKWLKSYLFHHDSFTEDALWKRSALEAKYHDQNYPVPNDQESMENYYSANLFDRIGDLLSKRLKRFDKDLPVDVLNVMKRILSDHSFKLHRKYAALAKKIRLYDAALKIVQHLSAYRWQEALTLMESQITEFEALPEGDDKAYFQMLIEKTNEKLLAKLKSKMLSRECLKMSDVVRDKHLSEADKELKLVTKGIASRRLSPGLNEKVMELMNEGPKVRLDMLSFLDNLRFERLYSFRFTGEQARNYAKYIAHPVRKQIRSKIDALRQVLPNDSVRDRGLAVFNKIMMEEEENLDENEIIEANNEQQNLPQLANQFHAKLLDHFKKKRPLSSFSLFSENQLYLLNGFINCLTEPQKHTLCGDLHQHVDYLYSHLIPTQIMQDLPEWDACGTLFHSLSCNREADVTNHIAAIDRLFGEIRTELLSSKYASPKESSGLVELPSTHIIEAEQELMKHMLFIRAFGDKDAHTHATKLIDEVLRRWRRGLAKGVTGVFYEHSLDFGKKLILIAGNKSQQAQCSHLVDCWNSARAGKKESWGVLREAVVDETISDYAKQIDTIMYRYFAKKFNIPEQAFDSIKQKRTEWNLDEDIVDPETLIKQHSLDEFREMLGLLVKKHASQSSTLITDTDVTKLYVAFCVSVHAQQLIRLWKQKLKDEPDVLKKFSPSRVSDSLGKLIERLRSQYSVGRGEFNNALTEVVTCDKDYFIAWSGSIPNTPVHAQNEPEKDALPLIRII